MARAARANSRADTVLLIVCLVLGVLAIVLPNDLRRPVAEGLRRTALAPLLRLQGAAERGRAAIAQHDAAVVNRDSMALRATAVAALESENDRLRKILGLSSRLRWGFVPAEILHGKGLGEEFTVALTAGDAAGVRRLSPVVAPEGLVGMVTATDPQTAQAIVWSHPDFRVSAMSTDGRAFGIVRPHIAGSGASRYLLEMSNVPFRNSLPAGALIVSSGLGGTYPRGIPIGTVMQELTTAEGWARTYLIRPAVSPGDVTAVMVLLPQRAQAGVASVWTSVAAADSAARAIASQGEDAARRTALAELAARRALTDSMAVDDSTNGADSASAVRAPRVRRDTGAVRARPDSAAPRDSTVRRRRRRTDSLPAAPARIP
ncbi:MAG: rod shape-determining protein MreC [Gemmatimonadetes bacterium]|nr:rod shape-determining protein MreC [Gemmatimonadota bacterium]